MVMPTNVELCISNKRNSCKSKTYSEQKCLVFIDLHVLAHLKNYVQGLGMEAHC